MRRVAFGSFLIAVACSGTEPLEVRDGCQPLAAGVDCVLPYPSDFFRADDGVVMRGAARLVADDGTSADLGESAPIDGFSRQPLIVVTFAEPVDAASLVGIDDDPVLSMAPATSATLILDATSGAAVPHYADVDPLDGERNALVLHPLVALDEATRYVVVVAGLDVPPLAGFARVRDGEEVAGLERYEDDVLAVVDAAGIDRSRVQAAWDFTTGRDEAVQRDLLSGRELMREAVAATPPAVTIEEVIEEPPDPGKVLIWREVHGTITVPMFVDIPDRGATLLRDANGDVRIDGTTEVPFVVMIPKSVRDTTTPGRTLCYGHGFFGQRTEALQTPPQEIADAMGAVVFAIDWQGMSMRDVTEIVDVLVGEPYRATHFTDRVHQGMLNWIAFTAAIRGPMRAAPELQRADGTPVFDASQLSFLGISQGHILGGVMTAVNPDIDRIALTVGGSGLVHMMARSKPFEPFLELMALAITDPLERLKYVATMQRRLDVVDPATYAPYLVRSPLPGTVADRKVLMQLGVADTSVPDVTGYFHARQVGAQVTSPTSVEVFGLEPFTDGDAALTVFDFGADRSFMRTPKAAPSKNEVHEGVRRLPVSIAQLDAFLREGGTLAHPCEGACDPE